MNQTLSTRQLRLVVILGVIVLCAGGFLVDLVDQHRLDAGDLEPDRERVIRSPVNRCDLFAIPCHLFKQRAAQRLQRTPFDLVAHAVRI